MTQWEMMKLFSEFEELSEGDFTPEELEEFLAERGEALPDDWKKRYFDYYDDVKDKSLKKQDW